jgi:hypothetical protein
MLASYPTAGVRGAPWKGDSLVGWMGQRHFSGTSPEPRKLLENAQSPTIITPVFAEGRGRAGSAEGTLRSVPRRGALFGANYKTSVMNTTFPITGFAFRHL